MPMNPACNSDPMTDDSSSMSDLIAPRSAYDDLSLEELGSVYAYGDTVSDRKRLFVLLIHKEIERRQHPVTVLDIGCGGGISAGANRVEYLRAIASAADVMYGVEPDESVDPVPGVFDHYQHALMETANLPAESIDLAYSFMVMEHVADPKAFFAALHRVLKPGGSYLFITPNGHHAFTIQSKALHALGLDELVLRLIRGGKTEDYHYPVQYKCQTPEAIRPIVRAGGFEEPVFATAEPYGMTGYFRGPLRPVLWGLQAKRRLFRNPACLLNLICRVTKPGGDA